MKVSQRHEAVVAIGVWRVAQIAHPVGSIPRPAACSTHSDVDFPGTEPGCARPEPPSLYPSMYSERGTSVFTAMVVVLRYISCRVPTELKSPRTSK